MIDSVDVIIIIIVITVIIPIILPYFAIIIACWKVSRILIELKKNSDKINSINENVYLILRNNKLSITPKAINIKFICSYCEQPLEIEDKYEGKTISCPACKKEIVVPLR